MDRLQFGTTARKRARRRRRIRRLSLVAWVASTLALAGGPLYSSSHAEIAHLVGFSEPSPAPSISAASSGIALDSTRELVDEGGKNHRARSRGASGGSVTEIIEAAAREFDVDGDYMVAIATCESGLNPRAYNSAGYHGLFQYDSQTWASYGSGSIWDPVAQARTTARLIAAGQSSRWPNCG